MIRLSRQTRRKVTDRTGKAMMQRTLFDVVKPVADPPHSGPETSRAAAEQIKPAAGKLRRLVYWYIVNQGPAGATDHEVSAGLGLQSDTCRARRVELRDTGHVVDSGQRRPTPSGRGATVWVATDKPLSPDDYQKST